MANEDSNHTGGDAWGDDIPPERQAELEALFQRQREWAAKPETERGESAFKDVRLTGSDVFWLAARTLAGTNEVQAVEGQMEWLRQAQGLWDLRGSLRLDALHLEGVRLRAAHLKRAVLRAVHLEDAYLFGAHLESADLFGAHLEGARLRAAHLKGANLTEAHLEYADLVLAKLEHASLAEAHLEHADLGGAHLESAYLAKAHLEGADLREAFLDTATNLNTIILGMPGDSPRQGYVRVADVRWGGVNLAVIKDWPRNMVLGDEREAWAWQPPKQKIVGKSKRAGEKSTRLEGADAHRQQEQDWQDTVAKAAQDRLEQFRAAVRANRQLATVLREQGMNEEADRFAYRAQVCQRQVYCLTHQRVRRAFSWLLDALAGYGYRPERSLYAYLLAIIGFGIAYFVLGHLVGPTLSPVGAFVYSMTSFHGRGFFPGGIALDDPITVLAALEAFVGLVIEVSFIATFTQRFFAR